MKHHPETHFVARVGWLRAAVLGANDGIVSTASLVMGVAAASASRSAVLLAGVAGLVAGAMSTGNARNSKTTPSSSMPN
jgi:VIT1/CCC1 family predicted Fe2+/Mn2+ transporter